MGFNISLFIKEFENFSKDCFFIDCDGFYILQGEAAVILQGLRDIISAVRIKG